MLELDLYDVVAETKAGTVYLSPDRATIVTRFVTLADANGTAKLAEAFLKAMITYKSPVFITDASNAEGASFDAMWRLEEALTRVARVGVTKEWRHVPSGSVVLQTALRRLLRQAQSLGILCGIYRTFSQALSAHDGCQAFGRDGFLSGPTGMVARTRDYVLAELTGTVSDVMLDIHMDAVSFALLDNPAQRVVFHLKPGLELSVRALSGHLSRTLALGGNPVVVVADEAGLLAGTELPDADEGVLHVTANRADAEVCLGAICMDKFRLPAFVPSSLAADNPC